MESMLLPALRKRWNNTYIGYYFTERLSKAMKILAMKIHGPQSSRIYFLVSSERLTLLKAQLHCWGKQVGPAKELQMPICLCSRETSTFTFIGS